MWIFIWYEVRKIVKLHTVEVKVKDAFFIEMKPWIFHLSKSRIRFYESLQARWISTLRNLITVFSLQLLLASFDFEGSQLITRVRLACLRFKGETLKNKIRFVEAIIEFTRTNIFKRLRSEGTIKQVDTQEAFFS